MPAPDSSAPEPPPGRPPVFTIASWVVPATGGLITFMIYQNAVAHRQGGDWLPGIGQLLVGAMATAFATFACGLSALLRREQNRWLTLLPFLTSLGMLLYFGWNFLRNTIGSH